MKKRFTAFLMTAIISLSMMACSSVAEGEMTAVTRNPEEGMGVVFIEDEQTALAGSVPTIEMTEAERVRAAELRVIAVEAFDLVNVKRQEAGLPALVWDENLELCAQVRATEIQSLFSHTRPNGSDWYTVNADLMWGENLAKGYHDATALVDAWMNSPTHAANILDGGFVTCSIAVYELDGKLFYAQEFGF